MDTLKIENIINNKKPEDHFKGFQIKVGIFTFNYKQNGIYYNIHTNFAFIPDEILEEGKLKVIDKSVGYNFLICRNNANIDKARNQQIFGNTLCLNEQLLKIIQEGKIFHDKKWINIDGIMGRND